MIQVPEAIKELYHLDTCKKNIRIHFPNGERSDICNDLIVKDTVSFTESLCSQNSLKFGLAESPVFECETVGVGNIKGATIEVFCEIYCDSTITGAEWKVDLQAYVYAIPYGVFVVESCQRQGDMIHRKIVAYHALASADWQVSKYEALKNTVRLSTTDSYNPVIPYFMAANNVTISDDYYNISSIPVTFLEDRTPHTEGTYYAVTIGGVRYNMAVYHTHAAYSMDRQYNPYYSDLFRIKVENFNENAFEEYFQYISAIPGANGDLFRVLGFQEYYHGLDPAPGCFQGKKQSFPIYLYPWINNYYNSTVNGTFDWSFYNEVTVNLYTRGATPTLVDSKTYKLFDQSDLTFERMTLKNSDLLALRLNIPRIKGTNEYGSGYFIDYSEIDLRGLANAFFEIFGTFNRFTRQNTMEMVNLKRQFGLLPLQTLYPDDDVYPQGVTGGWLYPKDYRSCWYDDEYTKLYGKIVCYFKDTNDADCIFILYLTGVDDETDPNSYMTYEINDNIIIQNNSWTASQIQTICEQIAPNIDGVQYMPVDFVGRGLPYVEAGDTFEILTKSNESITTIVLNRTITGEQTLTDSYKSVGE